MRKMRVMVTKYGYAVVEAETEETALQKVSTMDDSEFDWSDPDDGQVVDDDVIGVYFCNGSFVKSSIQPAANRLV